MATFQLVVADPEEGTAYQLEVEGQDANRFVGRELGEEVEFQGVTLELTGGSDETGRPMRGDVPGTSLKELLLEGGVGYKPNREGERKRITVRGNEVADDVAQINAKVVEGDAEAAFGEGGEEAEDAEDDE
ncbi:MAG: 30S ribosomal protein S6e [Haloferacaceae archaeon]